MEATPNFPLSTKQRSLVIDHKRVEIIYNLYSNQRCLIVTLLNKLGTMV